MSTRHYQGHTSSGSAVTRLVLASFRLHGALLAAGDRLAGTLGLTAGRWQVLGAVAASPYPAPVAHIAREMGLTRQSVQRLVDQLAADGLLAWEDNPHHKRAALVVFTDRGRKTFDALTAQQIPWANELAKGLKATELETATALLRRLEERLGAAGATSRSAAKESPRAKR